MAFFRSKRTGEQIRNVGAISTVGLSFVFAIVLGVWFGRVLDRWFDTAPLFFILFFFFGLAAGILNVYRTVQRAFPPSRPQVPPPTAAAPPGKDDLGPSED